MKANLMIIATALAASTLAAAGNTSYEYARVVDVEPIRQIHRTPVDREVCWDEAVHVRARRSDTPTVVGAILGGVIGNQFGSGSGRRAATAAGALLGGAIGRDAGRHDHGDRRVLRQRCQVEREWRERTVRSGYRVTYEYGGRLHRTTLPHHPGERIRVRVSVDPAH